MQKKTKVDKNCEENVRVDKWLWAIRVYKTRSLATDACKNGRVSISGVQVKPSRSLKVGDVVNVRHPPITKTYRVLGLLCNRMSASLVPTYRDDITPIEELEQLRLLRLAANAYRDRGTGRPTKKDRRDLEEFTDFDDWEDDDHKTE